MGVNQTDDGGQVVLVDSDDNVVADQAQITLPDQPLRPIPIYLYRLDQNYPGDWILWPRQWDRVN